MAERELILYCSSCGSKVEQRQAFGQLRPVCTSCWVQVQENVGQNGHGPRTAIARHAVPEDAAPDLRIANVVPECSEHTHM